MPERNFRDLVIAKQSFRLSEEVYRLARAVRPEDRFLARDMFNSVLIASAKMARGYANVSAEDRRRSFSRAFGKLARVDCQLLLVRSMDLVPLDQVTECQTLLDEVRRLLTVLENAWYDS